MSRQIGVGYTHVSSTLPSYQRIGDTPGPHGSVRHGSGVSEPVRGEALVRSFRASAAGRALVGRWVALDGYGGLLGAGDDPGALCRQYPDPIIAFVLPR